MILIIQTVLEMTFLNEMQLVDRDLGITEPTLCLALTSWSGGWAVCRGPGTRRPACQPPPLRKRR